MKHTKRPATFAMMTAVMDTLEQRRLLSADAALLPAIHMPAAAPAAHAWRQVSPRPVAAEEGMAAVLDGRLYTFGGFDDEQYRVDRSVWSYSPADDSWRQHRPLPTLLTHAGVAVSAGGGSVYMVGGYVGHHPGLDTTDVWRYDARADRYDRMPDLPVSAGAGGAALVGDTLYAVGGRQRTLSREGVRLWALDLNDPAAGWQKRADLPKGINHFATAAVGDQIYVLGGQVEEEGHETPQDAVYRYDTRADRWHAAGKLPRPMDHQMAQTIVKDGLISLVGGEYFHNDAAADWYVYDPKTQQTTTRVALPAVRRSGYAGLVGDTLVHAAGWADGRQRTHTWTIDIAALGTGSSGNNGSGASDNGSGPYRPDDMDPAIDIVFRETFNERPGATAGTAEGGVGWSASGQGTGVAGGRFEARHVRGDATWASGPIDLTGGPVDLSIDLAGEGGLDASGQWADWLEVWLDVDGRRERLFRADGQLAGGRQTVMKSNIAGTSARLEVRARTTAGDEVYAWDNVALTRAADNGNNNGGNDNGGNDTTGTLFRETFDEADGRRDGMAEGGTRWRATGIGGVSRDAYEARRALDTAVWTSDPIALGNGPAELSLTLAGLGGLDAGGQYADWVEVYVTVDGRRTRVARHDGPLPANGLTIREAGITGNSAVIEIRARTTASDEAYRWDDVTLTATSAGNNNGGGTDNNAGGFDEAFADERDGARSGTDVNGVAWRADAGGVSRGAFEVRRTTAQWSTDPIALGDAGGTFSAKITGEGGLDAGGQYADWVEVWLDVDGRERRLSRHDGPLPAGGVTVTEAGISGQTARIIVRAKTTGSDESYRLDDVRLAAAGTFNPGDGSDNGGDTTPGTPDRAAAVAHAEAKLLATLNSLPAGAFPDATDAAGRWQTVGRDNWVSGFYPGTLWQMAALTGDAAWADRAAAVARPLVGSGPYDDDIAFRRMTALLPLAGDPAVRADLLAHVAAKQANWNETVGAYSTNWRPSTSGDARATFGMLMDQTNDLELQLWAADVTGDATLRERAYRHGRTVAEHLVRRDGSSVQWAYFDEATGGRVSRETFQGLAADTTWSRGQAWGILALATLARDAVEHGHKADAVHFAGTAGRMADWFLDHAPRNGVPPWDFGDTSANPPADTSAAAVAAAGMIDLSQLLLNDRYARAAETIAATLASDYASADDAGVLTGGAGHVPAGRAVGGSLIYGDYYYLRLLNRLGGKLPIDDPFAAGPARTAGFGTGQTITDDNRGHSDDNRGQTVTRLAVDAAPPPPRSYVESQSVTLGGATYVAGGYDANWALHADTYRFDGVSWRRMSDQPIATTHAGVAADESTGLIWVVGGYQDRGDGGQIFGTTRVWTYDPAADRWSPGPSLPVARAAGGAAVVGRTLYYFGGETLGRTADARETFALDLDNPSAGWTRKADMPVARNTFTTSVFGGKIHTFGGQTGYDGNLVTRRDTLVYDPAADRWTRGADLPAARSHMNPYAPATRGHALVMGGMSVHNAVERQAWAYDFAADRWTALNDLPAARASTGVAQRPDNRLLVTGGFTLHTHRPNDAWYIATA